MLVFGFFGIGLKFHAKNKRETEKLKLL
jgi:hypothetical protein